ncbi:helix-turn-helix domain-containing protein [Pseudonocardia sp. GCM10023141]|uniref:helix-turn-helix domain-containing protein n=1 Tax=Pseudonocardia sp. GCM10023141 TaxID=3252653 RepID=UPI0036118802
MTSGPGRPRHTGPLRPGSTGREQILDAAAELFTVQGFAPTSTRAIADAVGIRQASLYHHFATKDDILDALLSSTVIPVLPVAEALLRHDVATPVEAAARLYALALHDGGQLAAAPWNLGVLYLAPELRRPRFLPFLAARERLRCCYVTAADALTGGPSSAGDLAFRLVESIVNLRADGLAGPQAPREVAAGCVRIAGWTAAMAPVEQAAARLSDELPKLVGEGAAADG